MLLIIRRNDQGDSKRPVVVLLLCVLAAEKTTSGGCGIHGGTDRRNYGERIAQELRRSPKGESSE